MGTRIVAAAMAVPPRVQDADELAPLISKTREWIVERTGVERRHVGDASLESPILAACAARDALANQATPDLIIYGGGVQHQAIPDTSVFVSRALGFEGIPSFSVDATCLSFLVALNLSDALLANGSYSRILICSADLGTRARNMRNPDSASLLGDGAAAALVERTDGPQGIEYHAMKTWPSGVELAEIRGGGTRVVLDDPATWPDEHLFHMDGRGLLKLLKPKLRTMLDECCSQMEIGLDEIDLVIPHQTSKAGFRLLAQLGLPAEKTVNLLSEYGNCVAAAMPMALAHAMTTGRLEAGQRVLFIGSAAGVSVGLTLMRW